MQYIIERSGEQCTDTVYYEHKEFIELSPNLGTVLICGTHLCRVSSAVQLRDVVISFYLLVKKKKKKAVGREMHLSNVSIETRVSS